MSMLTRPEVDWNELKDFPKLHFTEREGEILTKYVMHVDWVLRNAELRLEGEYGPNPDYLSGCFFSEYYDQCPLLRVVLTTTMGKKRGGLHSRLELHYQLGFQGGRLIYEIIKYKVLQSREQPEKIRLDRLDCSGPFPLLSAPFDLRLCAISQLHLLTNTLLNHDRKGGLCTFAT